MLGGWLEKADGIIFTNWKYGVFDDSLPYGFATDYGFKPDPDILVKCAIDFKLKLLYVKEEFSGNELVATELVSLISSKVGNKKVHAESADQRINEMLRRAHVNVIPTKKYPNSVIDGIKMVQDYTIIVCPDSIEIGRELNNYVEKNGSPLSNGNDHRIDAIRYYVMGEIKQATKVPLKVSI